MVSKTLTAESTDEQGKAGLTDCTPQEFATIQRLNTEYNDRFGFPFILAVRGPRGTGLTKREIIATFARRVRHHPDFELAEALRNIHRIAEIRLNDKFGVSPELGNLVWDWAERLAQHSDAGYAERGELGEWWSQPNEPRRPSRPGVRQRSSDLWPKPCSASVLSMSGVNSVDERNHCTRGQSTRAKSGCSP